MRVGSVAAMVLLSLVSLAHLLRLIFGVSVTAGDVVIPMWVSPVGVVVPAAVAFMLRRESRGP